MELHNERNEKRRVFPPYMKVKRILVLTAACMAFLVYLLISSPRLPADLPPMVDGSPVYLEYLQIDTPGYKLPRLRPWDYSLKPFLAKALDPNKNMACSKGILSLTHSQGNKVFLHDLKDYRGTKCCYSAIIRVQESPLNYTKNADRKYRVEKECHPLKKSVTVINAHSIYVKCKRQGKIFYKTVHNLVDLQSFNSKVEKWNKKGCDPDSFTSEGVGKIKSENRFLWKSSTLDGYGNQTKKKSVIPEKEDVNGESQESSFAPVEAPVDETAEDGLNIPYSVVIFGIDSVSRQNLQRYMPKTFNFLKKSGAIDLLGFNKVADNTFPNLMPIMAGKNASQLERDCLNKNRWNAFDNCSFIWSNFSDKGYLTVYAEDAPDMSLFHYKRPGFIKQPTDLYLRPFFIASDKLIGHSGKVRPKSKSDHYCQGSVSSFEVIKQHSLNVIETLGCLPHFGLYWTAKITHNLNHFASLIDSEALEYLEQFLGRPSSFRTFLFFMSDHGMRFGKIRETNIGKMEGNLPYMFIYVPSDFKKKYPTAFMNMVTNQHRLTCHYDIHSTLLDILGEKYRDESYVAQENVISRHFPGLTLFRRIPDTRTCKDARISPHFCAGLSFQEINVTAEVSQAAAKFVFQKLNKGLERFPQCHQFTSYTIKRVMTASSSQDIVRVWLQTIPGKGEMEATLLKTKKSFQMTAEVSRINTYKGQSDCIADDQYRKYCFCK